LTENGNEFLFVVNGMIFLHHKAAKPGTLA